MSEFRIVRDPVSGIYNQIPIEEECDNAQECADDGGSDCQAQEEKGQEAEKGKGARRVPRRNHAKAKVGRKAKIASPAALSLKEL